MTALRALAVALTLAAASPALPASAAQLLTSGDRASFARLSASLGGRNGVAVSNLGRGQAVTEFGSLRSGVAWSTIKPAIAIATYDRAHGSPNAGTQALIRRAITESDNAAAQSLWDHLGGGTRAAGLVQRVLSAAGDTQTTVHSTVSRPGYSAFGQTSWSLRNQLDFMAGVTCLPHGLPVLGLMSQIVPSQQWGLGSSGARAVYKGGWGPSRSGPYLVRQMGILSFGSHQVAVTIATVPRDGSFNSGTANLTKIARWLRSHLHSGSAPVTPRC
jgi:hypothetical protein